MKALKMILFVCVSILFAQCKTIRLTEKAPFNTTSATYQNWVGGQPGVSGINVIIGVANETTVEFTNLYFRNKIQKPMIETRKGKKYLVVNISTSTRGNTDKIIEEPKKKTTKKVVDKNEFPFTLAQNEAVIQYQYKGKTFYYKITNIKKTATIYYP